MPYTEDTLVQQTTAGYPEQRLEQELKRDYHIITAKKRLDQVARDFVQHYSKAWECGKAMLVCIDKITCVRTSKRKPASRAKSNGCAKPAWPWW